MTKYSFVTTWKLAAPLDHVWDAIYNTEQWPEWWQGVKRVKQIEPGDKDGTGALQRYTWKGKLPYSLVFDMRLTAVQAPYAIEGVASGELEGKGRWHLSQVGDITVVRYYWDIRTTKAWMNLLSPIALPLFKMNHDIIMGWGGEGLARLLGTRLL